MKHRHLITESNRLDQIYSEPPVVAYRKDKSLKDLQLRAKTPFAHLTTTFWSYSRKESCDIITKGFIIVNEYQ